MKETFIQEGPRLDDEKWELFVEKAFAAADLPEVPVDMLEAGTYTNTQIAEKFRQDPVGLVALLMALPKNGSVASRRSILSFAVETIEAKKEA